MHCKVYTLSTCQVGIHRAAVTYRLLVRTCEHIHARQKRKIVHHLNSAVHIVTYTVNLNPIYHLRTQYSPFFPSKFKWPIIVSHLLSPYVNQTLRRKCLHYYFFIFLSPNLRCKQAARSNLRWLQDFSLNF